MVEEERSLSFGIFSINLFQLSRAVQIDDLDLVGTRRRPVQRQPSQKHLTSQGPKCLPLPSRSLNQDDLRA